VDAERKVAMAEFNAQAAVKTANGAAQAKKINANADAEVTRVNGQAEAGRTLAVGQAEAAVIKQKIDSMESGNYAIVQVAQALSTAGVRLVPEVLVNGGTKGGGGGTLVDVLLAGLVKDRIQPAV
jgi:regulator of protease activity HflC (stomatin/prohibitin superfamily)